MNNMKDFAPINLTEGSAVISLISKHSSKQLRSNQVKLEDSSIETLINDEQK